MKSLIDYPNNDLEVHRQVVIRIHAFSCFKLDYWSDHHSLEMGISNGYLSSINHVCFGWAGTDMTFYWVNFEWFCAVSPLQSN
jgi:hypothetical protein